jgi:Regulator of G protein signaling domain
MSRRTYRPTLSTRLPTASRDLTPNSYIYDSDADDEGAMSSGGSSAGCPSRPLSIASPSGPCCPRRPTLAEVLSNTAPPPWTLSAFMQYLSQNHCLETLEFTMDATRYRTHFQSMSTPGSPQSSENCEYVKMLWQRLLDAYIAPNGPREVNLPCAVRDQLLSLPNIYTPPAPESLEPAVHIIYELMDESVLVPFLNSVMSELNGNWNNASEENVSSMDERTMRQTRTRRGSPKRSADVLSASTSYSPSSSSRNSASSSHSLTSMGGQHRISTNLPRGYFSPSNSGIESMSDDSGSASSPTAGEPMTPPNTPPTSDCGGLSPRNRNDKGWKKMTGKLGFSKRKTSRTPSIEDEGHLL